MSHFQSPEVSHFQPPLTPQTVPRAVPWVFNISGPSGFADPFVRALEHPGNFRMLRLVAGINVDDHLNIRMAQLPGNDFCCNARLHGVHRESVAGVAECYHATSTGPFT